MNPQVNYRQQIIEELAPDAEVVDLHIWKISGHHYSAAIALQSDSDLTVNDFRQRLAKFDKINHLTLELN